MPTLGFPPAWKAHKVLRTARLLVNYRVRGLIRVPEDFGRAQSALAGRRAAVDLMQI